MKKTLCLLLILIIQISIFSAEKILNPIFSKDAGFYDEPFYLEITSNASGARIYYTLDGSEPSPENKSAFLYEKPIYIYDRTAEKNIEYIKTSPHWSEPRVPVFKGTVVRARVYWNNLESEVITKSYFVGRKYDLPVISIVTDPNLLFDEKSGIYVPGIDYQEGNDWTGNYYRRGRKNEIKVHFEFFENGKLKYSDYLGMRINGNFSRQYPMKSLKLYARSEYGRKKIEYPLFPNLRDSTGEPIKEFDTILLRNGGNEFGKIFFKDAYIQKLLSKMGFETQAFRPAIHFINGVYWGIINIRERYDTEYFKNHYFTDDVTIVEVTSEFKEHYILDEGKNKYLQDFINLRNFIVENDMSNNKNYEYVKSKLDVQNYINFHISEMFIDNRDWPSNNMKFWRKNKNTFDVKGHDGKWRLIMYDTDNALYLRDYNMFVHAIDGDEKVTHPNPVWSTMMTKKLLENVEFRNQFLNTYMDHLNTTFRYENTSKLFLEVAQLYEDYLQEHLERWNLKDIREYYSYLLRVLKERPVYVKKQMEEYFGVKILKMHLADFENGKVKINTVEFSKGQDIEYIKDIPITLIAIAQHDSEFKYWEINGEKKLEAVIRILPEENLTIKPVFEKKK